MNLTHNVLIDSPPIECYKLKIVSVYLITVMIASAVVNLTLLVSLVCNRDMCKNSLNVLIVALCVLNLIGTFGEFPFVIVSNYNCRYLTATNIDFIFKQLFFIIFLKQDGCLKGLVA